MTVVAILNYTLEVKGDSYFYARTAALGLLTDFCISYGLRVESS